MYTELRKFEKLEMVENLDIVNLGTGMGYYDFCYDGIFKTAFNLALPQQNLYFDYQLLKKYSFLLKKEAIICIVLPYCIFCADQVDEIRNVSERYYFLLEKEDVISHCSVSYDEWMSKKIHITDENDALEKVLTATEMEYQSEGLIDIWKHQLKITSFESGEISPYIKNEMEKSKKWLRKILEYCQDMQYRPVIIVPPMSQILLDKMSMEFRKSYYYDILQSVVPKNVQILDYSQNMFFCNPNLYGCPGFLVKDASKEFTKNVLYQLFDR